MIASVKAKRSGFPVDGGGRGHVGLYEVDARNTRVKELASPTGLRYFAPFSTAMTSAVNGTMWALLNPSTNVASLYVRQCLLGLHFHGTAAAGSFTSTAVHYSTAATSITGGTAIVPTKRLSTQAASVASCMVATDGSGTALTLSSTTTVNIWDMKLTVSVTADTVVFPYAFARPLGGQDEIVIRPGEALVFSSSNLANVVTSGFIEWEERQ